MVHARGNRINFPAIGYAAFIRVHGVFNHDNYYYNIIPVVLL